MWKGQFIGLRQSRASSMAIAEYIPSSYHLRWPLVSHSTDRPPWGAATKSSPPAPRPSPQQAPTRPPVAPLGVAPRLPQHRAADVGRGDEVVASGPVPLTPVVLHQHPDQSTLGMEERQTRTDVGVEAEEVEPGGSA